MLLILYNVRCQFSSAGNFSGLFIMRLYDLYHENFLLLLVLTRDDFELFKDRFTININ